MAKPKPKEEAFFTKFGPQLQQIIKGELAALKLMLEGEPGPPPVVEEPSLAVSAKRFLTQPIHAH